ncbi:PREDICTED: protein transport protein Sec16B-like, partial [Propithecus coquereli]|uniref:protein transport protein Sec16B-like n=1 Tax=Propithecus coquereli TaxID=379532 RepID=UPI00063F270C
MTSLWCFRPGYADQYQSYQSAALREEYTYRRYYYQWLQEERVPRQGSPYVWYEGYQDQKYLDEHRHESQNRPFGTNNETQFHSAGRNPHGGSPASSSGQEGAGELLPDSLRTGARENK